MIKNIEIRKIDEKHLEKLLDEKLKKSKLSKKDNFLVNDMPTELEEKCISPKMCDNNTKKNNQVNNISNNLECNKLNKINNLIMDIINDLIDITINGYASSLETPYEVISEKEDELIEIVFDNNELNEINNLQKAYIKTQLDNFILWTDKNTLCPEIIIDKLNTFLNNVKSIDINIDSKLPENNINVLFTNSNKNQKNTCNIENNNLDKTTDTINSYYESVNHPEHYNNYDIEVIDMMERIWGTEKTAIFCELNAFKYRMRMGTKPDNDINQDIKKEKWYIKKYHELINKKISK